jgi:hypothetical protein
MADDRRVAGSFFAYTILHYFQSATLREFEGAARTSVNCFFEVTPRLDVATTSRFSRHRTNDMIWRHRSHFCQGGGRSQLLGYIAMMRALVNAAIRLIRLLERFKVLILSISGLQLLMPALSPLLASSCQEHSHGSFTATIPPRNLHQLHFYQP